MLRQERQDLCCWDAWPTLMHWSLLWVYLKLIMDYVVFCLNSLKVGLLFASKEALRIESSYMSCDA